MFNELYTKFATYDRRFAGGIPYTAHGAQLIPPPLYFDFCLFFLFMLILGWVR